MCSFAVKDQIDQQKDAYELEALQLYTDRWHSSWISAEGKAYQHQLACELRAKYRMSYEVTDSSGITTVDINKLNQFIESAYVNNPQTGSTNGYYAVGLTLALSDSPAVGVMDIIGIVVIGFGVLTKGSRPKDLEKGMTNYQKGKFQREIEDFKKYNGMPPNYDLPWVILKEIAEEVFEKYKNK